MMFYLIVKVMWALGVAIGWMLWALAMVAFYIIRGLFVFIPWVISEIVKSSRENRRLSNV